MHVGISLKDYKWPGDVPFFLTKIFYASLRSHYKFWTGTLEKIAEAGIIMRACSKHL